MTPTPESQHTIVAAFNVGLPIRHDAERVRAILAAAFVDHADELWPAGDDAATPEWIRETSIRSWPRWNGCMRRLPPVSILAQTRSYTA